MSDPVPKTRIPEDMLNNYIKNPKIPQAIKKDRRSRDDRCKFSYKYQASNTPLAIIASKAAMESEYGTYLYIIALVIVS